MNMLAETEVTRWRSTRGIVFDVRGTGDPVLLLHGIGGNATACGPLAELLTANGYRTICWDAPGYGSSADPRDPASVDHVAEVVELVEEFGCGAVHLVGTSWGGVIAMQMAVQRPDLVRSLVLADSTRGSGVSVDKALHMRRRVEELTRLGARAFAAGRAPRLVSPHCRPDVARAVALAMAEVRVAGYTAAAEYMARTDCGGILPDIVQPTLVVVGADDVVTGVDESRLLAEHIPGAQLMVVPEAGHAAIQEKSDVVDAAILTFWNGANLAMRACPKSKGDQ